MTPEQFNELCKDFLQKEEALLAWKRTEYSSKEDRLQNFQEVATFLDQRPAEVALIYLLKHIQSIALAVRSRKYRWCWETVEGEGMKQRIADSRNYLLLLAACLDEESEVEDELVSDVCSCEKCKKE